MVASDSLLSYLRITTTVGVEVGYLFAYLAGAAAGLVGVGSLLGWLGWLGLLTLVAEKPVRLFASHHPPPQCCTR